MTGIAWKSQKCFVQRDAALSLRFHGTQGHGQQLVRATGSIWFKIRVLEELEKEAELQLFIVITKAWIASDEADVQGVDGEATAGWFLWALS